MAAMGARPLISQSRRCPRHAREQQQPRDVMAGGEGDGQHGHGGEQHGHGGGQHKQGGRGGRKRSVERGDDLEVDFIFILIPSCGRGGGRAGRQDGRKSVGLGNVQEVTLPLFARGATILHGEAAGANLLAREAVTRGEGRGGRRGPTPPSPFSTSEEGESATPRCEARAESKGDSARDRDLGEDGASPCCAGVADPGDADAPASGAATGAVAGAATGDGGSAAAEAAGKTAIKSGSVSGPRASMLYQDGKFYFSVQELRVSVQQLTLWPAF
ncbi:hypothetical protein B0T18DRAFT_459429 [Schizothecium vesticola]|uniref:Uncharacterized protein n=1 Tax=Schizothecium vesticola TaxID=314040 RepID=A0AA40F7E5_9PEZI|nr:hypothetical protein B0T18DRAFT_459429 [Schizothecium vesticola]